MDRPRVPLRVAMTLGYLIRSGGKSEVLIGEFVRIYAKNRQIPSPEKLLTWLRHMSPVQTAKASLTFS